MKLSELYSFIANPKMSLLERAVSKLQLCTVQSHLVYICQFSTYPGEQQLQLRSTTPPGHCAYQLPPTLNADAALKNNAQGGCQSKLINNNNNKYRYIINNNNFDKYWPFPSAFCNVFPWSHHLNTQADLWGALQMLPTSSKALGKPFSRQICSWVTSFSTDASY